MNKSAKDFASHFSIIKDPRIVHSGLRGVKRHRELG